jgi:class 3 adenylate cyclase/pimeloyl-ACP methyl ester carboxylesterase
MSEFELPVTRYAMAGDVSIAYQVLGEGPIDIVIVPGSISHIEFLHEFPGYTAFLRRLAAFARVVTFDKRGQGLSDRAVDQPSLEARMDDVRAVMDDIGSPRAVLLGFSEGSAMGALFAATYPERVSHLVLFGGFARYNDLFGAKDPEPIITAGLKGWGNGAAVKSSVASRIDDPEALKLFAKLERLSGSPGGQRAFALLNTQIDVRPTLAAVRVPTLVMHRRTDARIPVAFGRDLAARISGAKYIEYPDGEHVFWTGDVDTPLGDIEEFVTGQREGAVEDLDRVLATVLFTDIVDSTRSAAEMGDKAWRRLLDDHDQLAKQTVEKHRGTLVKSTGDGILATFDGPARAVRCALAFGAAARQIGLPLRAGLHTGEIEIRGRDIGGIAVHAAARVMAQSGASEVLVSRVVTDLVAGAGLRFSGRGSHELKGLPGNWELFAASL